MYYGIAHTIAFFIALFGIIPLGLFLCKRDLKFLALCLIGLIWVTIYFHESSIGLISRLEITNKIFSLIVADYIAPAIFFCVAAIVLVILGLKIHDGENRKPKLYQLNIKEGWLKFTHWFTHKESLVVCAVAIAILVIHLVNINNPPYILQDEKFYVPEAYLFLHGLPMLTPEHPPLAKWFIAFGIKLFGFNTVGWRIFPILFGVASIFIFYFTCRNLVSKEPDKPDSRFRIKSFVPLLATFLFAFENMSFYQAHVATLDIFFVTFMLLGFLLYLRGSYLASGIAIGLSVISKEFGILALIPILLHWIIVHRSHLRTEFKWMWAKLNGITTLGNGRSEILNMGKLIIAIPIVWGLLLPLLEYGKTSEWANPLGRVMYILIIHTALALPSEMYEISKSWTWLISPTLIEHGPLQPLPYFGSIGWTILALIIPSMVFLIWEAIRGHSKGRDIVIFTLFWFVGMYGLIIILNLLARPVYNFHFYPAIPAACLAIAWGFWRLWGTAKTKEAQRAYIACLSVYLAATVATFIIMSPMGTNLVTLP